MIPRRQLAQRDVWWARALANEQSDVVVCSLAVTSFRSRLIRRAVRLTWRSYQVEIETQVLWTQDES